MCVVVAYPWYSFYEMQCVVLVLNILFFEGSPESVLQTINELEENIQEGLSVAKKKQREILLHAKVVGTSCDVCKPEDVKKLVNFAKDELGSIDIWVNNLLLHIYPHHLFCIISRSGTQLDTWIECTSFCTYNLFILFCTVASQNVLNMCYSS